jgi:hypothetical protein
LASLQDTHFDALLGDYPAVEKVSLFVQLKKLKNKISTEQGPVEKVETANLSDPLNSGKATVSLKSGELNSELSAGAGAPLFGGRKDALYGISEAKGIDETRLSLDKIESGFTYLGIP